VINDEIFGLKGRAIRLVDDLNNKYIPTSETLFDTLIDDTKTKLSGFINEAKQQVDETVHEFQKHIAAKEAVTYWAKKRTQSLRGVFGFLIFSGVSLIITLTLENALLMAMGNPESPLSKAVSSLGQGFSSSALLYAAIIFLALPGLWATRFSMGAAAAGYRYARYCDNKAMQIQTFLAMKKDGQIEEEQNNIVIEKLFSDYQEPGEHPSSDIPSIGSLALLTKAVQGRN